MLNSACALRGYEPFTHNATEFQGASDCRVFKVGSFKVEAYFHPAAGSLPLLPQSTWRATRKALRGWDGCPRPACYTAGRHSGPSHSRLLLPGQGLPWLPAPNMAGGRGKSWVHSQLLLSQGAQSRSCPQTNIFWAQSRRPDASFGLPRLKLLSQLSLGSDDRYWQG